MEVTISGHHVEVTDSLKNYTNSKLKRLSKHFDHINQVHVVLTIDGHRQKAEATLHLKKADVFAHAEGDLYAAIDTLAGKLDRQIIKYKEKHVARKAAR